MREVTLLKKSSALLTALLISVPLLASAQPSPDRLADMMAEKNNGYLANIERVEVTMEMDMVPMGFTTTLEKRTDNGMSWLAVTSDDSDFDSSLNTGLLDDQAIRMVRAASSVSEESLNNHSVYKVIIDDKEFLADAMDEQGDFGLDEDMFDIEAERVTLWIDREMLVPRKVFFEQRGSNDGVLNVEMIMDEYQMHDGLPIAHAVHMRIEGLETQFSESELEEARRMMAEMEDQLQHLPESQRAMIEGQLRPQLERFEEMLKSGDLGSIAMRITDVKINP